MGHVSRHPSLIRQSWPREGENRVGGGLLCRHYFAWLMEKFIKGAVCHSRASGGWDWSLRKRMKKDGSFLSQCEHRIIRGAGKGRSPCHLWLAESPASPRKLPPLTHLRKEAFLTLKSGLVWQQRMAAENGKKLTTEHIINCLQSFNNALMLRDTNWHKQTNTHTQKGVEQCFSLWWRPIWLERVNANCRLAD